ncbi:hypothetical protein GCM10027280_22120 [Micromonospora polyrhachis]|uniref:Peptidoglycan/LPS O-acetylase OafA/YrhL n=1 Tax=Micromonospora polyrhachis TaxID=1282883 RepID=A0A7W7SXQ2_9ACTN|nr:hypothetical protein [Micromonospora polyrhachis]MBB4961575.1 peptidoglycan/LPS O-acetylase OafA/YrhL [Micromonospora polyrhachis]
MTEVHNDRRKPDSAALWAILVAVGTAAVYGALFAWDQHRDLDPETMSESGPYEAWQVILAVLLLGLLAFVAGRRGRPWVATIVLPVVFTLCFTIDAATDRNADGLWIIGAFLVAIGSLAGTAASAGLGLALRNRALRGAAPQHP